MLARRACSVDSSKDAWTTYTRVTATMSIRQQSVTIALSPETWSIQVLCPGTVDPFVTRTVIVQ